MVRLVALVAAACLAGCLSDPETGADDPTTDATGSGDPLGRNDSGGDGAHAFKDGETPDVEPETDGPPQSDGPLVEPPDGRVDPDQGLDTDGPVVVPRDAAVDGPRLEPDGDVRPDLGPADDLGVPARCVDEDRDGYGAN